LSSLIKKNVSAYIETLTIGIKKDP